MNNINNRINQLEQYLVKHDYKLNNINSLAQINISLSRHCERACPFCPNSNTEKIKQTNIEKGTIISLDIIDRILQECKEHNFDGTFSFSGFGEPTYHPAINIIIKRTIEACPTANINIISNGDNFRVIKQIVKEFPKVSFTISEYSKMETDFHNVIFEGIPNIRQKQIYKKENYDALNNRAGNVKTKKDYSHMLDVCYIPFFKMTIDVNGDILLCDNDWYGEHPCGNILTHNIWDIWNHINFLTKRDMAFCGRSMVPLCRECNANGKLYGKQFFDYFKEKYINDSSR